MVKKLFYVLRVAFFQLSYPLAHRKCVTQNPFLSLLFKSNTSPFSSNAATSVKQNLGDARTNFRYKKTITFDFMDTIIPLIYPWGLNSIFSNHILLCVHTKFEANCNPHTFYRSTSKPCLHFELMQLILELTILYLSQLG